MKVISFFESENKEHWLAEIKKSDWSASEFLYKLLNENTFFDTVGEGSDVLLLTDGNRLVSHCTFAFKDDIQPTELNPWMGFIYTFPEFRGHRYVDKLFDEVERRAANKKISKFYISTNHIGLYEKYGCEYIGDMKDVNGEPSRVYVKNVKFLTTERLILRQWNESDAEDLYAYAKDPAVGPPAGWKPHESVEESRLIIKQFLSGEEAYAVCLKEDGKPIGAIELILNKLRAEKPDECELGYWLAKPFWGQGIIPEASKELIRRGFEELGMNKIWCAYYDGNEKSKRVQEKLGFKYQYTNKNTPVPAFNEFRTEHVSLITIEDYKNRQQ